MNGVRGENEQAPLGPIMVSSEGLLWYIFPVERLVGLFRVNFFFPPKKPKMTAGMRWCLSSRKKETAEVRKIVKTPPWQRRQSGGVSAAVVR